MNMRRACGGMYLLIGEEATHLVREELASIVAVKRTYNAYGSVLAFAKESVELSHEGANVLGSLRFGFHEIDSLEARMVVDQY